jgi:DtxR family Mn-dependent transcriptional regulator
VKDERVEEYLEALYKLTESGKPAKTNEIASTLGLSPSSVTEMLKKLKKKGFVKYKPYYGVTLTRKGRKHGRRMTRRHRILERFLSDVLKIEDSDVHDQACEMEHAISDEVEEALCRFLRHPEECSDDEKPIPPCDKEVDSCVECIEKGGPHRSRGVELVPLVTLRKGEKGTVRFLRGGKGLIRRLSDMGLTRNTKISVNKTAPFRGPIEICVRGTNLALGRGVANKVFVQKG